MQMFKRFSAALKASEGKPILSIRSGADKFYFIGIDSLTEVGLLEPAKTDSPSSGRSYAGHVCLAHLARLGNANWAQLREGEKGGPGSKAVFGGEF